MFKKYDPLQGKRVEILGQDGNVKKPSVKLPTMNEKQLVKAYETMVMAREADQWAISLNRQGRMPTYPPAIGQEACSVGSAVALEERDWIVPTFRELGAYLYRGIPLSKHYQYFLGMEEGSHFGEINNVLPYVVPLGSQTPHAVGVAYAEKYRKKDTVVLAFIGDGATSEGEFYEGMNFAGVMNVPVVFFIQNNQWAISTCRKKQTATETLAQKAIACGFNGVQVDGNDVMAVYAATKYAVDLARKEHKPTLIEGVTYRMSAHTTADDPSLYRDEKEVEEWVVKDPILRLEKYLLAGKIITDDEVKSIGDKTKKYVKESFNEVEKMDTGKVDEIFAYTYAENPPLLAEQLKVRKQLLQEES